MNEQFAMSGHDLTAFGASEEPQRQASPSSSLAFAQQLNREPGALQAIATAFISLFSIVGLALWGLPFFYDFMVQQFGWSRAEVTSGNALSKLVVGPVFGFFAGWIIDRFGPRRLMMAGILMAGAALIGLGGSPKLGMFYFFYLFNALGYVCGGPLPNQVLLSRWFDKSRGKAMGIAYLGIGLGGAAVPWISSFLLHRFGWQVALQLLGVLIIVLSFPMAFFLKDVPGTRMQRQDADTKAGANPAPVMGAFKSLPFYLLLLGSMCSIAAVSGTQQNLKLFLSLDQHYSQFEAARVMSLTLTFSIVGRLLMDWLADRLPKRRVMLLIYALVAVGIPLIFAAPLKDAMYVFAFVFGMGLGGDYMIIPLMTAEIFDVRILGRLLGVILTADGVAEAVSPWLIGHLRDVSGNYMSGFILLIAMAFIGTMAALGLPEKRRTA